jgi:hypothetical protein
MVKVKSRIINNNSKINDERNDIQQIRRGGPNWNTFKLKIKGERKEQKSNTSLTGKEIFKKDNYNK